MNDNRIALSEYRLDEAARCIRAAKISVDNDDYKTAVNRSYYAFFHCIRSVLALDGINFKKHSAVIGHFRKEYIKTGIFDTKYSDYIGVAFDIRGDSDYEDFYIISKQEVNSQILHASEFFDCVKGFLSERIKSK